MDARDILVDAAGRPMDSAEQVLEGLSPETANRMPDNLHSSISWLVWHSGRQMDAQLSRLSGAPQVWRDGGWVGRFSLDRPDDASGFGDKPADVAKVRVSDTALLTGYLGAVVEALVAYVRSLSDSDLDDVIGHFGGQPVTRGVRIVSMIDDAVAHVAQAAYLRGLLENWRIGY
ncbi:MAG TPA: DinB family protein [Propionibacteriaceae bacterium]|nr:DinB family protein [Propionibacteriaceae bacterium]